MKTLRNISVIALFGLVLISFTSRDNSITISQALLEKKIEMEIVPYRTYDANGIQVVVKNISGKSLTLKMPLGTTFSPDADEEQTLIRSEEEIFALNNNQSKTLDFIGYCTELHDRGCDEGTTFRMDQTKNTDLLNLLSFMDSLRIKDENTIQHAIWSITDQSPLGYVTLDTDTSAARKLREYICTKTGQANIWYNTASEIVETPEHEFVIVPKEVKGEITFESTEEVHLYGVIKDSTGKVLHTSPRVINAPAGVEVTFDFALTVIGWAPGKYSVVYTNNGKEVINQGFEI